MYCGAAVLVTVVVIIAPARGSNLVAIMAQWILG